MARTHCERAGMVEGVKFVCAYDTDRERLEKNCADFGVEICNTQEEYLRGQPYIAAQA